MKKSYILLFLITINFSAKAIDFKTLWTFTNEKNIPVVGEKKLNPSKFLLVKLNTIDFQIFQSSIPSEESGITSIISLPTPEGDEMKFQIFECPMMEKKLADKFPQIKTYTAVSIDNPTITAKIDFTLFGFHAKVFNESGTYFIDPYTNVNTGWYMIYYKKDYSKPLNERMQCLSESQTEQLENAEAVSLSKNDLPDISYKQNGVNKRTYRLALACTQEYSAAVGGATPTVASVLSAMVTSVNRINGVFEREFSMHANLVANNDTLIYLTNDPYTNNNGGTMLGQNQTTVNTRIGQLNYDFGHVFSTGGGGIASLGCVCNNTTKAQGVTGSSNPVGDPFDIDYVAHEMGHQFGGSHTFNSITGSCGGNRSSSSAYEIGSGTTIMSYAGICGSDDIQPHSDDYYHIRSLEQMTGTGVTSCPVVVASNNSLPVLSPVYNTYIIPYRTAFELTAIGTDADNDPLTYCWEEWDRGGSGGAWNAATTVAPILRSIKPSTSPTRVFPTLNYLLQNSESYLGERLPDNARIVKFKCTLRDMHLGYGAFYTSTDSVRLDVKVTTGLFRVTSQNTVGQQLDGYSPQTVTWDVAGTDVTPFTTTNVDIYLSVDSGKTWPHQLANAVPNNGTRLVYLPNVTATWARIKVKGNGNVFFDLNDEWIKIKQVTVPAGLKDISTENFEIFPNPSNNSIQIRGASYQNATKEIFNALGQKIVSTSKNNIDVSKFSKGIYFIKIKNSVKKLVIE